MMENSTKLDELMRLPSVYVDWGQRLIESVENGDEDPLSVWVTLKRFEEMIKYVREATKDAAIQELEKYGKQHKTIDGAQLTIHSGRRIFGYKHNAAWQEADANKKRIEEMMKSAMKYPVFDEETGEQVPPADVTYTSETVSITL